MRDDPTPVSTSAFTTIHQAQTNTFAELSPKAPVDTDRLSAPQPSQHPILTAFGENPLSQSASCLDIGSGYPASSQPALSHPSSSPPGSCHPASSNAHPAYQQRILTPTASCTAEAQAQPTAVSSAAPVASSFAECPSKRHLKRFDTGDSHNSPPEVPDDAPLTPTASTAQPAVLVKAEECHQQRAGSPQTHQVDPDDPNPATAQSLTRTLAPHVNHPTPSRASHAQAASAHSPSPRATSPADKHRASSPSRGATTPPRPCRLCNLSAPLFVQGMFKHYCASCASLRQRAYKKGLSLRDLRAVFLTHGPNHAPHEIISLALDLQRRAYPSSLPHAAATPGAALLDSPGGAAASTLAMAESEQDGQGRGRPSRAAAQAALATLADLAARMHTTEPDDEDHSTWPQGSKVEEECDGPQGMHIDSGGSIFPPAGEASTSGGGAPPHGVGALLLNLRAHLKSCTAPQYTSTQPQLPQMSSDSAAGDLSGFPGHLNSLPPLPLPFPASSGRTSVHLPPSSQSLEPSKVHSMPLSHEEAHSTAQQSSADNMLLALLHVASQQQRQQPEGGPHPSNRSGSAAIGAAAQADHMTQLLHAAELQRQQQAGEAQEQQQQAVPAMSQRSAGSGGWPSVALARQGSGSALQSGSERQAGEVLRGAQAAPGLGPNNSTDWQQQAGIKRGQSVVGDVRDWKVRKSTDGPVRSSQGLSSMLQAWGGMTARRDADLGLLWSTEPTDSVDCPGGAREVFAAGGERVEGWLGEEEARLAQLQENALQTLLFVAMQREKLRSLNDMGPAGTHGAAAPAHPTMPAGSISTGCESTPERSKPFQVPLAAATFGSVANPGSSQCEGLAIGSVNAEDLAQGLGRTLSAWQQGASPPAADEVLRPWFSRG